MENRGVFISLEGIDGAGKTTLKNHLLEYLKEQSYNVIGIREPGGTAVSEKIRDLLLDSQNDTMNIITEALLYAAARSQLVDEVIRPALMEGKIVIADRYIDSTMAYQGYGRGLDQGLLAQLNQLSTGGLKPQLTLLLDLDPETGLKRRRGDSDRMEMTGYSFQSRVRTGYLHIAEKEPDRIKVLDARKPPDQLLTESMAYILNRLQ